MSKLKQTLLIITTITIAIGLLFSLSFYAYLLTKDPKISQVFITTIGEGLLLGSLTIAFFYMAYHATFK